MSGIIGSLRGILSLESAAFESGAKRGIAAMGKVERRMLRMGKSVEQAGRKMSLGLSLPMAGAAAVAVRSSLRIVDAQAKMAQSLGTTVRSMQVLQRAADLSGVSIGEVEQATVQLTKRLSQAAGGTGAAAKSLKRLQLNAEELQRLPLDERLSRIQEALARFVPEAERAAVASDLFGSRAGLIFTRIDTAALRIATDDIGRFGVAVSEVDADQIERTNDALSRMGLAGRGVGNQLTIALAPVLEDLAGKAAGAAEWFNGLSDRTKRFAAVSASLVAALGPLVLGLGLALKVTAPLGVAIAGVTATIALAPVRMVAAAKAAVALELALGAVSTKAALGSIAVKGMARSLGLLRLAIASTGIGALVVAAGGIYSQFAQSSIAAENYTVAVQGLTSAHDLLTQATDRFYKNTSAKNAEAMRRAAEAARNATREALEAARAELQAASFYTNFLSFSLYETDRMAKARADIEALTEALALAESRLDAASVAAARTAQNAGEVTDNIDAAAVATNPLIQGLGSAAVQASTLSSFLSGLPGALAGAQASVAGLRAGISVLAGGGGEMAANVAKYRAELEASAPDLKNLMYEQRVLVEDGINQKVRLYEENQRLSAEYRNQLSALNKVSSAGGSASKSALAALKKEIRQRRELLGLTDEQRAKLEAVRAVRQKLGEEGAGLSTGQIEGLADQIIELDRTKEAMDRVRQQQERWSEAITRTAFEGGSLTDTIKGMLKDIAFQFANTKIVLPVVASVSGVLGLGGILGGGNDAPAAASSALGGSGGGLLNGLLGNLGSSLLGGGGALGSIGSGLAGVLSGGGIGSSFANLGGLLSGVSGGLGAIGAALPAIGIVIAGVAAVAKAFSRKYVGSGIRGSFDADGFNGSQFDFYKGGLLRSNKTNYSPLEEEFEAALDASMSGLTTGLEAMAGALGLGTEALEGFTGEGFTLWTNGKSAEEIQEALQARIEETGTAMAALVLGTDEFSRTGESALETLQRLSGSLTAVNDMSDLLGHQLLSLSLTGADVASSLVDSFGGREAMNAAATSYFNAFYSDSERLETNLRRLREQFTGLGLTMPESREGFRELVESLDLTTESGREAYAGLLGLSSAMDQVLPRLGQFTAEISAMIQAASGEIALRIESAREMANTALAAAQEWKRTGESLRSYLDGLIATPLTGASRQQAAAAKRSRFQEAFEATKEGDQKAAASLAGLARDYLQSARDTARSDLEYRRLAAGVQGQLKFAAGISELEQGNDEVLAGLYQQQIDVLTNLDRFLQLEGLTDEQVASLGANVQELAEDWDGTVAAFQSSLGALEDAIENAEAFSYDDLVGRLDIAVGLASNAPEWLRHLVSRSREGIRTTLDFVIRRDDLTAADRWIATNSLSEHVSSLRLVLAEDLDRETRLLALTTTGDLRRNLRLNLTQDLDPETRSLVLTQSSDLSRRVNVALTRTGRDAIERLAELGRLMGSQGDGTLTFGGGLTLTADTVFSDLVSSTSGLRQPIGRLTGMLDALREAVRVDSVSRERDRQITGLQLQARDLSAALADRTEAQSLVSQVSALEASTGVDLRRSGGRDADIRVSSQSGRIIYSASHAAYGTGADIAGFREGFWADGALEDQLRAYNRRYSENSRRLEALRAQIQGLGGIPGFAAGGAHRGGWRVVGERGWELERTGPSSIVSHSDTMSMLDQRQVVKSVEALMDRVTEMHRTQAAQTQRAEMYLRRLDERFESWDEVGQPGERA